jgi:integrase/recombinase XerD
MGSVRTRNVRLAAIHAFFRYVAISEPAHLDRCRRILAIPMKRHERRPIAYLTRAEIDVVLATPDVSTWIGRRDRALLLLAVQTGLRVSELIHLRCGDIVLGTGAHLQCEGKGRKQRCTPLSRETIGLMTAWLRERNGQSSDPMFATARGHALSRECGRTPRRASCQNCAGALSVTQTQTGEPACPAAYGRDGTPRAWRRSRGHRPVARS